MDPFPFLAPSRTGTFPTSGNAGPGDALVPNRTAGNLGAFLAVLKGFVAVPVGEAPGLPKKGDTSRDDAAPLPFTDTDSTDRDTETAGDAPDACPAVSIAHVPLAVVGPDTGSLPWVDSDPPGLHARMETQFSIPDVPPEAVACSVSSTGPAQGSDRKHTGVAATAADSGLLNSGPASDGNLSKDRAAVDAGPASDRVPKQDMRPLDAVSAPLPRPLSEAEAAATMAVRATELAWRERAVIGVRPSPEVPAVGQAGSAPAAHQDSPRLQDGNLPQLSDKGVTVLPDLRRESTLSYPAFVRNDVPAGAEESAPSAPSLPSNEITDSPTRTGAETSTTKPVDSTANQKVTPERVRAASVQVADTSRISINNPPMPAPAVMAVVSTRQEAPVTPAEIMPPPATGHQSLMDPAVALVVDATAAAVEDPAGFAMGADTPSTPRTEHRAAPVIPSLPHGLGQRLAETVAQFPDRPVEVTLSPDELGRVRLSLTTHDGTLTMSVQADRPETLDLLRRNIDQLAQDFRDLGFRDLSFSFGDRPARQSPEHAPDETGTENVTEARAELRPARQPRMTTPDADGGLDLRL